jgi:ATP-dependent Lon protease
LRQEFELLDETRRQLAARTVLQDTFRDLKDSGASEER